MSFDILIFNAIHGLAGWSGTLDAAGVFFAQYLPYLLLIPLVVFLFKAKTPKERLYTFLFWALTALLSRGVITEIIRFFFPRERPFGAFGFTSLISESGASFPSGHAALLFAIALAVFTVNKKWGWWFLGLSFLNGVARIFVGVHYPSDIIGGFLVALISLVIVTRILFINPSHIEKKNIPPPEEDCDSHESLT